MAPKGSSDCGVLQWAGGGVKKHLPLKIWNIKTCSYRIQLDAEDCFITWPCMNFSNRFGFLFSQSFLLQLQSFYLLEYSHTVGTDTLSTPVSLLM